MGNFYIFFDRVPQVKIMCILKQISDKYFIETNFSVVTNITHALYNNGTTIDTYVSKLNSVMACPPLVRHWNVPMTHELVVFIFAKYF